MQYLSIVRISKFLHFCNALNTNSPIQLRSYETATKHVYEGKWGHFEREKSILKIQLASCFLTYLLKLFRSFNAKNFRSFGQRASKLQAVKVGGLKKKSAFWPRPHSYHSARVRLDRGQIILKVWWSVTLQPFNLQTINFQH